MNERKSSILIIVTMKQVYHYTEQRDDSRLPSQNLVWCFIHKNIFNLVLQNVNMIIYNCKDIIHNAFPLILCRENTSSEYFRDETPVKKTGMFVVKIKRYRIWQVLTLFNRPGTTSRFLCQTYQNKNFNQISDLGN